MWEGIIIDEKETESNIMRAGIITTLVEQNAKALSKEIKEKQKVEELENEVLNNSFQTEKF